MVAVLLGHDRGYYFEFIIDIIFKHEFIKPPKNEIYSKTLFHFCHIAHCAVQLPLILQ